MYTGSLTKQDELSCWTIHELIKSRCASYDSWVLTTTSLTLMTTNLGATISLSSRWQYRHLVWFLFYDMTQSPRYVFKWPKPPHERRLSSMWIVFWWWKDIVSLKHMKEATNLGTTSSSSRWQCRPLVQNFFLAIDMFRVFLFSYLTFV